MAANTLIVASGEPGEQKPDLNSLVRYYHGKLTGETKAYLYQRGLSDQTIETYQIGYDDGVRFGFIENVGVLGDYFRERYIFPIHDAAGRVVNMVGRAVANVQPVYKNLPGDAVVDANVLFNETVIKNSETVFLCEGIIDALTLIQASFPAVAILGPNTFRPEWAEKFAGKHVFICFDNDEVGRMGRDAVAQAISAKAAEVYFINLPEGVKDVNDFFVRAKDAPQNFSLLVYQAAEWGKYRQFPADSRNLNAFVQEYARRQARKMIGVPTGFTGLDVLLFGGLLAGLYLVTGKPAAGKITLLKNIADHLAAKQIPVLFVSLEMSAFELWAKSIARLAGVPAAEVIAGKADPEAVQAANQTYSQLAAYIWTVEGTGPFTVGTIDSYIYQTINELGTAPAVFIHSLQRIPVETAGQSSNQEMADNYNALALKRLARKYGCPVVVASSLETAAGLPVVMNGNSAAYNAADVVMYLEEADDQVPGVGKEVIPETKSSVNLRVGKNRNGVPGSVRLIFNRAHSVFEPGD